MGFKSGLRWGGREHRWERRTNYAIIIGIIFTGSEEEREEGG